MRTGYLKYGKLNLKFALEILAGGGGLVINRIRPAKSKMDTFFLFGLNRSETKIFIKKFQRK